MSARRYAVYFVPTSDTNLHGFGTAAIGYDCIAGIDVPFAAELAAAEPDWSALTREPRIYGFHATLKAPFRLREGVAEPDLIDAFARFAAGLARPPGFDPQVQLLAGFAAVVPSGKPAALGELAGACVREFEPFRAPLSVQERERRIAAGLDACQIANLDRWGYPFVFDEFRFHMTLTGRLPVGRGDRILARLSTLFVRCAGEATIVVDRIALVRQDSASQRFTVLRHAPIGAGCGG